MDSLELQIQAESAIESSLCAVVGAKRVSGGSGAAFLEELNAAGFRVVLAEPE